MIAQDLNMKITKGDQCILEYRVKIWFSRREFFQTWTKEFLFGGDVVVVTEVEDELVTLISKKGIVYARQYDLSHAVLE